MTALSRPLALLAAVVGLVVAGPALAEKGPSSVPAKLIVEDNAKMFTPDAIDQAKKRISESSSFTWCRPAPPRPEVAKTVPAPFTMASSESVMQASEKLPGTSAVQRSPRLNWWVRWYEWLCPDRTRSTFFSISMFVRSSPARQSYLPMLRQGVRMPTTVQGIFRDSAPSTAAAVQRQRGLFFE